MNSPTLALVRKDAPWLLAFLVLGTGLAFPAFLESGFLGVFVVPEQRFAEEFEMLLVPCAVVLALVSSLIETLRSTGDLLRHRPVGAARLFWTRHVAALVVIGCWTLLGTLAVWLEELVYGAGGACADPSRYGVVAAMTTGLALDYALVVLGLSLPMRRLHRFWMAGLLVFLRYAAQSALAFLDPSWPACLLVLGLAALAALALAAHCEAGGYDPDLPTPGRVQASAALVCVPAAAFFGAIGSSGWHELAFDALQRVRPCVGLVEPNVLGLLSAPDREGWSTVLDERGRPTARRIQYEDDVFFRAPSPKEADFDPLSVRVLHPPYAYRQSRPGSPRTRRVFVQGDAVQVVEQNHLDERRCWTLALPTGTTGEPTEFLELEDGAERPLFLLAPGSGRLTLVTAETPPRLVPQTLPDGDRPLRRSFGRDEHGETLRVLGGETASWRQRAGSWEAVPDVFADAAAFTLLGGDPLRPEVEVRLPGGVAFRHRYGLESTGETLCAAFAALASVLLPTPFAWLGASSDYAAAAAALPDEVLLVLDPLLGGGHRWLLGLNLTLTLALMAFTWRDLGRRGLGRTRVAAWTLAVLCAGVWVGPMLLLLEPRRAWRRPARSAPPAPLVVAA